MPNVVGMTRGQADQALRLAGVGSWEDTVKASSAYAPGTVIAKNPVAGTAVSSAELGGAVAPVSVTVAMTPQLPKIVMGIRGAEVIVPLTTDTTSREFRPTRAVRGKLTVEYACVGTGNFSLAFAGVKLTDTCDGQSHIYGDDSADLNLQTSIRVTADTYSRWHVIAIADK